MLILPGGVGGGVVNSKGLEEEAQFNIPVPVEEAQLNIHQTMVGSGRRCLVYSPGEFWSCRGEASTTTIVI